MLTNAQNTALKNAIQNETDPVFVGYRTEGATGLMAQWFNQAVTPTVLAWKTATVKDVDEAPSYTTYDSLTQGKRDSWERFLAFDRDFSKAKVRRWVVDVWGNATASSNSEAILQAGTRPITRGENVLGGTNSSTEGTVTARRLTWEGVITNDYIVRAVNS